MRYLQTAARSLAKDKESFKGMRSVAIILVILSVLAFAPKALAKNDYNTAYGGPTASDQVNQIYIPKFKLQYGADGSATDVSALNPLPVSAVVTMSPVINYALENGGHLASIDAELASPFTVYQGGAPWSVSQSGLWTTGRTWTLSNSTDSVAAVQSGNWSTRIQDGSGNLITSQVSGSQRALDVGIDVAGVQVDPRNRTWTLSSGTDSVNVGNFPATQAVTQSTSPWVISGTVTANAGTNLNTSALQLDTTGAKLNLAQASTTSGQTGPLIQGAVTAAAPTYGTGTTQPLSLTTAGALRTDASGTTQPISGTVTANQGGTWTTGRTWSLLNTTDSVNAVQSGIWTVQQGSAPWSVSQSGAWTTGRTWTLSSGTDSVASVQSGNWSQRLQDGSGNLITSQINGSQRALDVGIDVAGVQVDPRARTWTLSSGTDSVSATQGTSPWVDNITQFGGTNLSTGTGNGGSGIPRVTVSNDSSITNISGTISLPTGASTSANQTNGTQKSQVVDGSGNIQPSGDIASRKIFTALTDGTNTTAVKASSIAALATDPSVVVALSPNSPIPTGANTIGAVTQAGAPWAQNLTQVGGSAVTLGQKTMANSIPVALPSDQDPLEVELFDSNTNGITSQVNGAQRALDVGVNVAGVQVDPRKNTSRAATQPTADADGTIDYSTADVYGRKAMVSERSSSAYWGKLFRVTTNNNTTIGLLTEVAFFLFRNPNGSGVNCKISKREFGSVTASGGNATIYKMYRGATVTANGTALTSVGARNTGQATSQCLSTVSPTVTANGTLFDVDRAGAADDFRDDDFSLWVEPNNNVLVTVTSNATGLTPTFEMEWAEQ